jgi:hypothetical protein
MIILEKRGIILARILPAILMIKIITRILKRALYDTVFSLLIDYFRPILLYRICWVFVLTLIPRYAVIIRLLLDWFWFLVESRIIKMSLWWISPCSRKFNCLHCWEWLRMTLKKLLLWSRSRITRLSPLKRKILDKGRLCAWGNHCYHFTTIYHLPLPSGNLSSLPTDTCLDRMMKQYSFPWPKKN